jgi:hypothetical protein
LEDIVLSNCSFELYKVGQKEEYEKLKTAELFDEKNHHSILLSIDFKGVR